MHISASVSQRLVLVPILAVVAIQHLLIYNVSSLNMTNAYLHHKCLVNQGKYKPGSEYEKNLIHITHSISSTRNFHTGYETMSLGGGSDVVSAILQCRGDSFGTKCRSCYGTALSQLRRNCPRYKGGIIWYDQCFLEFSGIETEGQVDYENNFCLSNAKNVSEDHDSFNLKWRTLIGDLTRIIATRKNPNDPVALYAVGERRLGTKKLYGMMQCTRDLSKKGCEECYAYNMVHFQDCLNDKQGGRVLGRSCNFRFEFYPFVNTKADPKYLKN